MLGLGAVEMALRAGGRLEDPGGAPRIRLRAELRERGLEQRELAAGIAERAGGIRARGRAASTRSTPARASGVRHPVPQLERAVEQRRRLAVGVRRARRPSAARTAAASAAGWSPEAPK